MLASQVAECEGGIGASRGTKRSLPWLHSLIGAMLRRVERLPCDGCRPANALPSEC